MDPSHESWLGEFCSASSPEQKIPGLVRYSHSQGVSVRFLKQITSPWIQPSVLHGILETGEECTLLGPSCLPGGDPERYYSHHEGATVVSGIIGYKYFVIGKHIDLSDTLGEVSFTFPDVGRFATGLDTFQQTHAGPLAYCDQTIMGRISVWRQDCGASMLNIKEAVISSNSAAIERLCSAHDAIKKELGAHFMKRLSSEYRIILEFTSEIPLHDACFSMQKLVDLFSVLLYSPIITADVIARKGSLGDRKALAVYISHTLDERTISIIQARSNTQSIPIQLSALQFADIVNTWAEECSKYATLVSGIQSRTGIKAVHEVQAEIILCCAFMESIKHEAGLGKKYEDCLRNYACSGLQEKILAIFELDSIEKAGAAISEVRSDIVHFKGSRKWINKMPLAIACQLSQYLELTVLGYLLERLGVERKLIDEYQILQAEAFWSSI